MQFVVHLLRSKTNAAIYCATSSAAMRFVVDLLVLRCVWQITQRIHIRSYKWSLTVNELWVCWSTSGRVLRCRTVIYQPGIRSAHRFLVISFTCGLHLLPPSLSAELRWSLHSTRYSTIHDFCGPGKSGKFGNFKESGKVMESQWKQKGSGKVMELCKKWQMKNLLKVIKTYSFIVN